MATAAQVNRFQVGNDEIERMIRRDVNRLWSGMRGASANDIRDALLEVGPRLSAEYGAIAATMAAEFYEEVTGTTARMAGPVPDDAPRSSVRYGVSPLYAAAPNGALAFERIGSSLTRHALQQGRSTIHESAAQTPGMAYARVPEIGACAWCLMLSSRGAVYASTQTAGGDGSAYHDDCRCTPTPAPIGDDSALPYDRQALYDRYAAAHSSGNTDREVAAKMRELYGLA